MKIIDLGRMTWQDAWRRQEDAHADVLLNGPERIFIVEHEPVVTLGRQAELARKSLRFPVDEIRGRGVDVVETDRGGNVTFHGPGQIVAYPIVRLATHKLTVGSYVRTLQEAVIDCLARCTIRGQVDPSAVGVWVQNNGELAKICAIGVRVKRGVTMHGLALNVDIDLSYTDLIVPCGLEGRSVTSMRKILGATCPEMSHVKWLLGRSLVEAIEGTSDRIPLAE